MLTVQQVLDRLDIDQKVKLLTGKNGWQTRAYSSVGLESLFFSDGPHGIRKVLNSDQIGPGEIIAKSVCFPCACTTANSWDKALLENIGSCLGKLARKSAIDVVLGPGVNIKRNPLCGRSFEYFSEDPQLAGQLGASWIKGLQSQGVGASLKHYCANNQETLRMNNSSIVDERTLHEIYLKPFEIAVSLAQPVSVMCSYNRLNGEYLSDSRRLLKDILVDELKFEGFIISDWGAVNDRILAIKAGLSLDMPGGSNAFEKAVLKALKTEEIQPADLDDCLKPMIQKILELRSHPKPHKSISLDEAHEVARSAAEQSGVLLKNDGVLPLREETTALVVGPLAKEPRYQGSGSSKVRPYKVTSLLDGLSEQNLTWTYRSGYSLEGDASGSLLDEAIKEAQNHDLIIVAAGLSEMDESEGFDRPDMDLHPHQTVLINRLAEQGKPVVVVLSSGAVVAMPWADKVQAILHMGLAGEASGSAAAALLSGDKNPSGKLAESYPIQYSDHATSSFWLESEQQSFYREGIYVGYRYYDKAGIDVRFPFGHGLSYTSFEYSDLQIRPSENKGDWIVKVRVKNTGSMIGNEIVQLYISDQICQIHKPEQELKAFRKIQLKPGEDAIVILDVPLNAFAHYDVPSKSWQVSNGPYEIRIGASSRDIRLVSRLDVTAGIDLDIVESGWYTQPSGTASLADYLHLFPDGIELEQPYQKGNYDINASLGQLSKDSWLVRKMNQVTARYFARSLGVRAGDSSPELKTLVAAAQSSALRNMHLMAPRQMPKILIRLILLSANGLKATVKNKFRRTKI